MPLAPTIVTFGRKLRRPSWILYVILVVFYKLVEDRLLAAVNNYIDAHKELWGRDVFELLQALLQWTNDNTLATFAIFAGFYVVLSLAVAQWRTWRVPETQDERKGRAPRQPLGEGWLEQRLIEAHFEADEVREHIGDCLRFLHEASIFSKEAASAFITDLGTRAQIEQIYREELRNPARQLEAYGFCRWGPRLHRVGPGERELVLLHLRQDIRAHLDPATGREKTREVQVREAIERSRGDLTRTQATKAAPQPYGILFLPDERAQEQDLRWWHVRVTLTVDMPFVSRVALQLIRSGGVREHVMLWATEDSLVEEVTLRKGVVCPVPVVARSDRGNGKLAACELSKGTAMLTDLNALWHGKTTALEAGRHEFRLILRQPDGSVVDESPPFVIEIPNHWEANDRGFDLLLGTA